MSETMSPPSPRPIDTCAWIGGYPFREVPHPEPAVLVRVLEREGFDGAWVGSLAGAFHRDPAASNEALYAALAPYRNALSPTPIVRPDWPGWTQQLQRAVDEGAPAVRAYPMQWGYGPGHPALEALARAAGEAGVALQLPVRFEDLRQRHHLDAAGDLTAAHIRAVARLSGSRAGLVISGAGRELIEEVHWGLTPDEQLRVWYDWHWIWGPPEDHFAHLVCTIGPERLTWSSWWPLRLTQQAQALVDLLPEELAPATPRSSFADGAVILSAVHLAAGR